MEIMTADTTFGAIMYTQFFSSSIKMGCITESSPILAAHNVACIYRRCRASQVTHGSERTSLSPVIHCRGRDAKRAERAYTHLCPPARTPGRCATELAGARVALLRCPTRSVRASAVILL